MKFKSTCGILFTFVFVFANSFACFAQTSLPEDELARIKSYGITAGKAMRCGLDFKSYFQKFMEVERKKDWTEEEIAYINGVFSNAQATGLMADSADCDEVTAEFDNKFERLKAMEFSDKPTKITLMLWYDLGENNGFGGLVVYPVGEYDHAVLLIKLDGEMVATAFITRAPETYDSTHFDVSKWRKAKGNERMPLAVGFVLSGMWRNKTSDKIIELLGKPNGEYIRKYGYKLLSKN